jgi:hypothetical protein
MNVILKVNGDVYLVECAVAGAILIKSIRLTLDRVQTWPRVSH